jgi:flagellar hook-basal body complex protein FliE
MVMVNRADINSVLLQMRQVRQQMQTTDPASTVGMQNSIQNQVQSPNQNSMVGAPQNSFAAQLQQQRSQFEPSVMPSSAPSNINPATMTPSQFRNELTQQNLVNQAAALDTRPGNQMNFSSTASNPSIGEMMGNAINHVNATQKHAGSLSTRYTQGDPNIDLPEVMVAMQKSSVSFQAMSQVRNKLLESYKDIMNMPV